MGFAVFEKRQRGSDLLNLSGIHVGHDEGFFVPAVCKDLAEGIQNG